jgi:hypothetical protein
MPNLGSIKNLSYFTDEMTNNSGSKVVKNFYPREIEESS